MIPEIILRLLWALVIIAAGLLAYYLFNRLILARAGRRSLLPPGLQTGKPAILYFTTPDCAPCRTIQRPALQRIRQVFGEKLTVIEVDASRDPDLARAWGVLSVPTTFVLDRQGKPHFVNHGAARAEKILAQLERIV